MRIVSEQHGSFLVLTLEGRLHPRTAPAVHHRMLVALAEYQQGIVCDVGNLAVTEPLTLRLFQGVGEQAMAWPGTPVILCRVDSTTSRWLRQLGVDRVVPVRATLAAAMSAPRYQPPVSGEVLRLPPWPAAASAAAEFVRAGCDRYSAQTVENAVLLVSEMVEHAAAGARLELCVLLSLRGPAIRIAVTDDNPNLPWTRPAGTELAGTELAGTELAGTELAGTAAATEGPAGGAGAKGPGVDAPATAAAAWAADRVPDARLLDSLADRWGALPTGSGRLLWCLLQE